MNSKECPECKWCNPDNAASCRQCGLDFNAHTAKEETQQYATKSQIAAAATRTAANFIDMEMWVEAYMELHAAARICWERRNEQRERPNAKLTERRRSGASELTTAVARLRSVKRMVGASGPKI